MVGWLFHNQGLEIPYPITTTYILRWEYKFLWHIFSLPLEGWNQEIFTDKIDGHHDRFEGTSRRETYADKGIKTDVFCL